MNEREHAIAGWYLYLSEQEQEIDERIAQYQDHELPVWLIQGIEWKFASQPRRVVVLE